MTLRALRIFVTLATYKNMTKTADKMFLTQSSISQVITQIEKEYNVVLFDRMKSGLVLTPVGNEMLERAQKILNQYDELESILLKDSSNPKIRIGASVNIGTTILESIVVELLEKIPNLQYNIVVLSTQSIEEKVLANEIDIAIVDGRLNSKDIIVEKLTDDEMILICSPHHKFNGRYEVTLDEIAKEPLILREESSGARKQLADEFKKINIEPNVVWTCSSSEVVKNAVKKNLGITVLQRCIAAEEVLNGIFWGCTISDVDLSREFKLIYHKDKYFTNSMDEFSKIARKITKNGD